MTIIMVIITPTIIIVMNGWLQFKIQHSMEVYSFLGQDMKNSSKEEEEESERFKLLQVYQINLVAYPSPLNDLVIRFSIKFNCY